LCDYQFFFYHSSLYWSFWCAQCFLVICFIVVSLLFSHYCFVVWLNIFLFFCVSVSYCKSFSFTLCFHLMVIKLCAKFDNWLLPKIDVFYSTGESVLETHLKKFKMLKSVCWRIQWVMHLSSHYILLWTFRVSQCDYNFYCLVALYIFLSSWKC
jgi:hypothetical protein